MSHALLRVIYFVLKERLPYVAYDPQSSPDAQRQRLVRHHCKRLRELGVEETLIDKALADLGLPKAEPKRKGVRRRGRWD